MTSQEKKALIAKRLKNKALELADYVDDIRKSDRSKNAVLLCEGTKDSIDYMLYKETYPEFIVIPIGGCTDVKKMLPLLERYCECEVLGLIDRDNNSKKQIRALAKDKNIFCTKLPFIENIICCPEVLRILARIRGMDYSEVISNVRKTMTSMLAEKMSLLNPFNVELPKDEEVQLVCITIVTKNSEINKNIDLYNIMYTFRDKGIVGTVADTLNLHGKEGYIRFFRNALNGEHRDEILMAVARHLPMIGHEGTSHFETYN